MNFRPKSLPQNVGGPVAVWKDVFTPKELDQIEALGDALMPMRAEIAGRNAENTDRLRITRVAWMERRYENGALAATERWTAILTIVLNTPHHIDRLRKNPLGIFVHAINWSKELG